MPETLGHIINGESVSAGSMGESVNPSNLDEVVARYPKGGPAEVDAAVKAARAAFPAWSGASPEVRSDVLDKAGALIMARAKGRAPKNQKPAEGVVAPAPEANSRPKPPGKKKGPSPFVFVGAAFAAGVLIAKIIDWRGHAHPRD